MTTVVVNTHAKAAILGIVQAHCRRSGLPAPSALVGSSNAAALQYLELLQDVGDDIATRTDWDCLRRIKAWSAVSGQDQGNIYTLFDEGFVSIVPETFWNTTSQQQILGPVSDQEWQSYTGITTVVSPRFHIATQHLYLFPAATAGDGLTLKYKSRYWIASDAGVPKQFFSTDTDVPLFPVELMKAGLDFFWRRKKELPHTTEADRYENLIMDFAGQNAARPVLQMDGWRPAPRPGIIVPQTGWL